MTDEPNAPAKPPEKEGALRRSDPPRIPVWAAAVVGFVAGYAISEWFGGVVGVAVVLFLSRVR
jgi:hypothetical protein